MARFNERHRVSREALLSYAEALRSMAATHELIAKAMENAALPAINPTHLKTALDGLVGLGRFLGASLNAYCDELNSEKVSEIEGAVEEIRKLTGRLQERLPDPMTKSVRAAKVALTETDRERRRARKKTKAP